MGSPPFCGSSASLLFWPKPAYGVLPRATPSRNVMKPFEPVEFVVSVIMCHESCVMPMVP
jgi:hypothetical protein